MKIKISGILTSPYISAFIVIVLAFTPALSQDPTNTSGTIAIQGTVTNDSGALIPGTLVRAKKADIRLARSSTADENGKFLIPTLPVGRYDIIAELPGFQTVIKEIDLRGNEVSITIDFKMRIPISYIGPGVTTSESIADVSLKERQDEAKKRLNDAEHLVEQMWEFSMDKNSEQPGNGQFNSTRYRQHELTGKFHRFGKEAIPAFLLALEDPDAQMRRNSIVVLLDLAENTTGGGTSIVDIREARAALIKAQKDNDPKVRMLALQAINVIRLSEPARNIQK